MEGREEDDGASKSLSCASGRKDGKRSSLHLEPHGRDARIRAPSVLVLFLDPEHATPGQAREVLIEERCFGQRLQQHLVTPMPSLLMCPVYNKANTNEALVVLFITTAGVRARDLARKSAMKV